MRCLDDCHNYAMETFMKAEPPPILCFYKMESDGTRTDGVTNEEVLKVLIHRISYLNNSAGFPPGKFHCKENFMAITKLEEALMWLEKRTADRLTRKVEGTHLQ